MRKITLFLLLSMFTFFTYAKTVSVDNAKTVAKNYMQSENKLFNNNVVETITINYKNLDVIYAFNFEDGGYILISSDDVAFPILSFAFEGRFVNNDPKMPAAYARWIQWYEDQLVLAKTIDIKPSDKTIKAWKKYSKPVPNTLTRSTSNAKSVNYVTTPLLDIEGITWDRGAGYNHLCPADANGSDGHVYVGCVATAMAQIMRYHKYPDSGTGSHTYTDDTYGSQTADFGAATYEWDNMPAEGITNYYNDEIAEICYHAGVAVDMDYGANGSGAQIYGYVKEAFINYFRYSSDATYAYRPNYNDTQWANLVRGSLDNGWPVQYSGSDANGGGGHAFVCDGYRTNDEYHFNWGWSGQYNSWNTLNSIVPGGTGAGGGSGDYSDDNQIVYNIHPLNTLNANFTANTTSVIEGGSVNFTDNSTDGGTAITSWSWTFQGGTPSSSTQQNPTITYNTAGTYNVTLTVNNGSSDTETKTGYITVSQPGNAFTLDFEASADFTTTFDPWTVNDVDGSATYGIQDVTFTGSGDPMAFIAFNPASCSPAQTSPAPHGGNRFGACFASTTPPNNDWLISSKVQLGTNSNFNLWVKSHTDQYGLERYKIGVSTTTNDPSAFTFISSGSYEEAPTTWTEKTYDLSAYDNQQVYIAINCVSNDAFIFMVDDISINTTTTGVNTLSENNVNIYPNPTTGILNITGVDNFNQIQVLDISGKIVKSINNYTNSINVSNLTKGNYIIKIVTDNSVITKRFTLIK